MRKGFLFLAFAVMILNAGISYSQTEMPVKENKTVANELKDVIKFPGGELFKQNIKFFVGRLTTEKVPQNIIDEVTGKVETKQFEEIEQTALSKYFTQEDVKAIIDFYQSPAGQKFSKNMPLVTQEYFKQYGDLIHKVYEQIFDKLAQKGYPLEDLRKSYLKTIIFPGIMPVSSMLPAVDKKQ